MRSRFERRVAKQLTDAGMPFKYEAEEWEYQFPIARAYCLPCGSKEIYKDRVYTPDFFLKNGIVIEAKGKLTAAERSKLVAIKAAHPDADLRLLFMRNNKISKVSKTRYEDWARAKGFICATGTIPTDWLKPKRSSNANKG